MQLNCLIFPSPKSVDVSEVKHQILLIPKMEGQPEITYEEYLQPYAKKAVGSGFKVERAEHVLSKAELTTFPTQESRIVDTPLIAHYHTPSTPNDFNTRETTPISVESYLPSTKLHIHQAEMSVPVHGYVPCLYLKGNSKRVVVFFHGNAEDLESSSSFVTYLQAKTGYTVVAMEYQGYSIYAGNPSAESVERDSLHLLRYLIEKKNFDYSNIVVLGRSIGSGPAICSAANFKVGALVLISPFLSICKLVQDKYGWFCSMLLEERFRNGQAIKHVQSPILIIHGLEDSIIPYHHSSELQSRARSYCKLKLSPGMSHSQFSFMEDFIRPLRKFLESIGY